MSQEKFEVKPVKAYSGATYFAAPVEEPEVEERHQPHPMAVALMFLLVLGLTLGLVGCYMRTEHSEEPPDATPDGGPDGDPPPPPPPPPPECDEGELRCLDGGDIEVCQGEEWAVQSCHERCAEELGPEGYSTGCDAADADDPCQCDYDVIDGDMDPCYPNDLYCADDATVFICGDRWEEVDCNALCQETHGLDWYSEGCNAEAEDPCQCVYGMLDGEPVECPPGDVICYDDQNVGVCTEGGWYESQECELVCDESFGPESTSMGCDATADDPCLCALPGSGSGGE